MTDIVERLWMAIDGDTGPVDNNALLRAINEIERLRKYEAMVKFIANDYVEMSYDKIKWQAYDWRKRCIKVIEEAVGGKRDV